MEGGRMSKSLHKNTEYYLGKLSHYKNVEKLGDSKLTVPDASKVGWRNVTTLNIDFPPEVLSAEDKDSVALGGDCDLESPGDGDIEALEHAGVWTDTEAVRMHIAHLSKLKSAYINEFENLKQILKKSKREYLVEVALEKETMLSIYEQSKGSRDDREDYERLRALYRYQKHLGKQGILRQKFVERRRNALNNTTSEPHSKDKVQKNKQQCSYSQGSWKCREGSIPLAKYCLKHILEDPEQVLYKACGSTAGGEDCTTAIIPLPHINTCIFHTPLPENDDTTTPSEERPVIELMDSEATILPTQQVTS